MTPTAHKAFVNLVIVSHSAQVAEGVREIACQMTHDQVRIAAAGGLRDAAGAPLLGTDALTIAQTIRTVWSPAGVLVLVDLGSSILSAELALDMLEPAARARCLISNAPLVEGAIVAAIEAGVGSPLEDVNAAAEAACAMPKR